MPQNRVWHVEKDRGKMGAYKHFLLLAGLTKTAVGAYSQSSKYLTWTLPVPKDSSPQMEQRLASIRLPKNFQPTSRLGHVCFQALSGRGPG